MKKKGEIAKTGGVSTEPLSQGLVEQAYIQSQTMNQDLEEVGTAYRDLNTGACATNPGLCAEHPQTQAGLQQTTAKTLQEKAKQASDTSLKTMRRWSTAVRNYGVEDLPHQIQLFARRHPGLVIGGALIAGFALTRAIKLTGNAPKAEQGYGRQQLYESSPGRDFLPAEEEVFHS